MTFTLKIGVAINGRGAEYDNHNNHQIQTGGYYTGHAFERVKMAGHYQVEFFQLGKE
ncbi:MAG: hypothetical protein Kow00127_03600 [Bacteroidales bacterium]